MCGRAGVEEGCSLAVTHSTEASGRVVRHLHCQHLAKVACNFRNVVLGHGARQTGDVHGGRGQHWACAVPFPAFRAGRGGEGPSAASTPVGRWRAAAAFVPPAGLALSRPALCLLVHCTIVCGCSTRACRNWRVPVCGDGAGRLHVVRGNWFPSQPAKPVQQGSTEKAKAGLQGCVPTSNVVTLSCFGGQPCLHCEGL